MQDEIIASHTCFGGHVFTRPNDGWTGLYIKLWLERMTQPHRVLFMARICPSTGAHLTSWILNPDLLGFYTSVYNNH